MKYSTEYAAQSRAKKIQQGFSDIGGIPDWIYADTPVPTTLTEAKHLCEDIRGQMYGISINLKLQSLKGESGAAQYEKSCVAERVCNSKLRLFKSWIGNKHGPDAEFDARFAIEQLIRAVVEIHTPESRDKGCDRLLRVMALCEGSDDIDPGFVESVVLMHRSLKEKSEH